MRPIGIVGLVIVFAVALGTLFVFGAQAQKNSAIDKELRIESSKSDLEAEYNRRLGLLTNLAEAVKSYDKHEADVIVRLSEARTPDGSNGEINASAYIQGVVERYPQLRSIENYDRYMKELSMTENRIASHRKYYNANVREYKLYVRMFPQNMFLGLLGYKPVDYKLLDFEDAPVNAPTGLLKD